MATTERPVDRGRRDGARHLHEIGRELREARVLAGLSQAHVGRAVGMSHSAISRIESAAAREVPLVRLDLVAAVLGLRLSIRAYPVGRAVRDEAQRALLHRLRTQIHASLAWRTEVPIPIDGDLRAWDAAITGRGWTMFVDAETRIRDVQALERRTLLKARDSGTDRVLLLIADTRSNRAVLRSLPGPILEGSRSGTAVLDALRSGADPGGGAVLLL